MKKLFLFALIAVFFAACNESPIVDNEVGELTLKAGHLEYFTYSENPVCLGDEVTVTFSNTQGHDYGVFKMQVWGPDGSMWVSEDEYGYAEWYNLTDELSEPGNGEIEFTFTPDVAGEYKFRGQWIRTGNPKMYPGESIKWQEADPTLLVKECGITGYGIAESSTMYFGDGGWAGWSTLDGTVIIGGGFQLSGGPAAASAPAEPESVWPHYTFGNNEYGWVVQDAKDGVPSPDSYIYSIYADMPDGYEIIEHTITGFSPTGWGGWSAPEGKVVLSGGFVADGPVSTSAPAEPESIWPHHIFGENEYGWVVQSAGATEITIYVVCANEPSGYEIVKSNELQYSGTGWAGWSTTSGKVVLGGGFDNTSPVRASIPATPETDTQTGYTYGSNEYGWLVQSHEPGGPGFIYVIYASDL